MPDRLLLDEHILADGRHVRRWASLDGGRVHVLDDAGSGGALSIAAVARVMERYGKPLEADVVLDGEVLELGDGLRLRRLRYHAAVDATGRDYLVWEAPGADPVAVLAPHAAAALHYVALRVSEN